MDEAVLKAISAIRDGQDSLLQVLNAKSGFNPEQAKSILLDQLGCQTESIQSASPAAAALNLIPYEAARHYYCMPLRIENETLVLAVLDPTDFEALSALRFLSGRELRPVIAGRTEILEAIELSYPEHLRSKAQAFTSRHEARIASGQETPAVEMADKLISEAIHRRASDIHCEPGEHGVRIRFRIDGVLQPVHAVTLEHKNEFISRIKIMAGMDIAEKRLPQDGRIQVEGTGRTMDIRVSSLPIEYGEKMVLRILDKGGTALDLEALGMEEKQLGLFRKAIALPHGIVLITGPTGSGKTTTLYGALNHIRHPGLNISTVEDPIEYNLDGINQTQVNADIGLTFASALRTLLRQDPNVIMIGEIRDAETAEIAIRASLTGHLVLSTLHTNDAPSAVTRLLDMGVEPYLVSSTLALVVAQRLVRRICPQCKSSFAPGPREQELVRGEERDSMFYKGKGCVHCMRTGYRGRVGIYEVMSVTDPLRDLIATKRPASEIRERAVKDGMVTLRSQGLVKARAGVSTLEEVLRETASL